LRLRCWNEWKGIRTGSSSHGSGWYWMLSGLPVALSMKSREAGAKGVWWGSARWSMARFSPGPVYMSSERELDSTPLPLRLWNGGAWLASRMPTELRGFHRPKCFTRRIVFSPCSRKSRTKDRKGVSTGCAGAVEAVLGKGWPRAGVSEKALRPYGDIDICVRPEQFKLAERF